jgi:3-hydroxyisobutyrate dehydrogenase
MSAKVGIIGFGEVGAVFSAAIRQHGVDVAAFDLLASRVESASVPFLPLEKLTRHSDYVLSTVTSREALNVAEACRPFLSAGKTYVDLNSTSPSLKRAIEAVVCPSGASFAEGAILGAVGVTGANTRILIGGPAGRAAAAFLSQAGLSASFYSDETGQASTFKMLRGIFSKGLEALLLELLVAARRAGIEDDLWADIVHFMDENDFQQVAANWVRTHPVAHARRRDEMIQVLEVLRELGVPAPMTSATEAFFARSCALGLSRRFPAKPDQISDVIEFLENKLR